MRNKSIYMYNKVAVGPDSVGPTTVISQNCLLILLKSQGFSLEGQDVFLGHQYVCLETSMYSRVAGYQQFQFY